MFDINRTERIELYKNSIATIRDFPKAGVMFKDISELLEKHLTSVVFDLKSLVNGIKIDKYVGIESRGFLFASALAAIDNKDGVVVVRKKGKLPPPVLSITYNSEYSTETLEVKACSDPEHNKVCIVDDCAALGNTFKATKELLERAGYNVVKQIAVFKLSYLPGDKSEVDALWEYI
jgi:adenine phosphoribosyltransferase